MSGGPADWVFGKYEIQRRLAVGGMGEVFHAVQRGVPGFERPVILKSLLPHLAEQKDFVDQFLDEARVAATLNHPNVVSIFEVGAWRGVYYIAMEYIRGRNLSQLLRRAYERQQTVSPYAAAQIVHDAALGLEHAHTAADAQGRPLQIIHRDVSPQNVMVRDDGVTKVVDFGIARAANRSARTAAGMVKGKLAYMAPEQLQGLELTPAADQFALGIVFWELLTGTHLFRGGADLEIIKNVLEAEIAAPSAVARGVPTELDAVVLRMLERDPSRRFPGCGAAAEVLFSTLAGRTPQGTVRALMTGLGVEDLQVQTPAARPADFVVDLKPTAPERPASASRPGLGPSRGGWAALSLIALFTVSVLGGLRLLRPRAPEAAQEPIAQQRPQALKPAAVSPAPPLPPAECTTGPREGICARDDQETVRVINHSEAPAVVKLVLEDEGRAKVALLEPGGVVELARQRPGRFKFETFWGRPGSAVEVSALARPFTGQAMVRGSPREKGHSAFDFEMPSGSPVFAADDGVIVFLKTDGSRGGPGDELKDEMNRIIEVTPSGVMIAYRHLAHDGALVKVGDSVRRGTKIGVSGATGRSPVPHLAVAVARPTLDGEWVWLNATFDGQTPERGHLFGQ
jgi:murein DD-endopeptidase MepM/ murein hydrolase activator NlpD